MADYKRDMLKIVDELLKQGWRVRKSKHYIAYPLMKDRKPIVLAQSPSDFRAVANDVARLRRAGAKI